MSIYYSSNHVKPNPAKTQICCFHLRNRDAKRKLDVTWNGLELDHYPNPIYLGVTLDRTLSFKQHALNTKAKVNTRNNLLRKLTNSRWGAHPATVRTTALALSFLTRDTHSMANALPSTGLHPETAFSTQQKHLTHQNKMLVPHCG